MSNEQEVKSKKIDEQVKPLRKPVKQVKRAKPIRRKPPKKQD